MLVRAARVVRRGRSAQLEAGRPLAAGHHRDGLSHQLAAGELGGQGGIVTAHDRPLSVGRGGVGDDAGWAGVAVMEDRPAVDGGRAGGARFGLGQGGGVDGRLLRR